MHICIGFSWLCLGIKLHKLFQLKELFAQEKDIKRKLKKISDAEMQECPSDRKDCGSETMAQVATA